ncbi:hypothetical protein BCE_2412 [Bacillus cereus ATCC 10987]|uniref:Uncharacterized protein n=1 Tax=Bacillus cereus (strain ATCC 10987 / NRS 248) TaxID=222523 RepID=Q738I2_BACC1|nr:hypothetical protein BCE_2412 [Bacillus cereus ATCC 10987]
MPICIGLFFYPLFLQRPFHLLEVVFIFSKKGE